MVGINRRNLILGSAAGVIGPFGFVATNFITAEAGPTSVTNRDVSLAAGAMEATLSLGEPVQSSDSTLAYVGEVQLSSRLREITLRTPALATQMGGVILGNATGETRVRVLLPAGYDPKGTRRYPVLYLYHGGGGNQADWTTPGTKGKAEDLTEGLPLIIVMPDGGIAGGYSDRYKGGAFGPPQWKTYHLDQLIPWVDAHFRTIPNRSGRATAGLSMGGGGLRYAAQRPDLIGATAAFSGDIDLLQPASDWNFAGAPISKMIWGDRKREEIRRRGASGVDLAKNLANTNVAIFTGDTGHPEGTYILQGSTAVHNALNRFRISHGFMIYPGMPHTWPTWNKALAAWLPHLMALFRHAPSASRTAAFTYSTIDPAYSIYNWRVEMHRKATEFSALEVAGPRSFNVVGSGSAIVHTPAIGIPNAAYRITIVNSAQAGRGQVLSLRADAAGALAVPVQLGPANPFQQYSPEADGASTGPSTDKAPFPILNNGSRFYRAEVRLSAEGRN